MRRHGIECHFYADDSQLYIAFRPRDVTSRDEAVARVEACVADIRIWMRSNYLKLNDDKTELLILGTSPRTVTNLSIIIGDDRIEVGEKPPRNLGVFFDCSLTMDFHIRKIAKSNNGTLYKIGKVRKYMDKKICETLINGLVTSRFDYCNSLLYGTAKKSLNVFQLQQNRAARIITHTGKFEHITHVRKELHWLPIKQRIDFKILLFTYKALNGLAPRYLSDLIKRHVPRRSLRSASKFLLDVPATELKTFGDRAFSHAAPILWNSLPDEIKNAESVFQFKNMVKTHLFKQAY